MDEMRRELSPDLVETIRLASKSLSGFKRRHFQAQMTLRYCDGNPRRAERTFGWGRATVETGLGELRSGLRCLEAVHQRGRKRTEVRSPGLVEEMRRIVEPTAQADPKFQTTLAYTRITAEKVRDALQQSDPARQDVPCRQTVGTMLNRLGYRLGYRLRRVLKTKPQKKSPRPTRSSLTSLRPGRVPPPIPRV